MPSPEGPPSPSRTPTPGRRLLAGAAAVLALAVPAAARALVLADSWYASTIQGKRVGYLHELREQVSEHGRTVVRTTMATQFTIQRLGTTVSVTSRAVFVETTAGEPIRFDSTNRFSANDYRLRAERKGDVFVVTQESMGETTVTEVPWADDILFPHAMERAIAERALTPGAHLELRTFTPDTARPTRTTVDCKGWEEVELEDGRRKLLRLDSSQDILPGVVLSEWRDPTGAIHKTRLPLLGLDIVSLRTSRERALLDPESVELLVSTLIAPATDIARPRAVTRARFKLALKERTAGVDLQVPPDERQRLVGRGDGYRLLEVKAEAWSKDKDAPDPGPAYRQASSVLQTGDARIRELAAAASEASGGEELARDINRWVYRSIGKKSMSVGLATAAEVARDLAGDCTEHAVLAAALGRARGLPTKVAMGIVYLDGVFGYHMWLEVFDHGWHALDPAFGQDGIDATHIKLGESALDQGFIDEGMIGLVRLIANLDVQVVEYEVSGRTYSGLAPAQAAWLKDDAYVNSVYGLKLRPPGNWRLLPRRDDGPREALVRLAGPDGAEGELAAQSVSYDFAFDRWVEAHSPGQRILSSRHVVVAERPAMRYVLEGSGRREGLLAFLDKETLFTLRLRPLGEAGQAALDSLPQSIQISN